MRISDAEVKRIINGPGKTIVDAIVEVGEENVRQQDQQMVKTVTADVTNMADREEMVEELRAQIAAGQYNPSGDEIVEAMLRRAIADNVR